MNEAGPKAYLAIFNLPKAQLEHSKIEDVIRAESAGDFKWVRVGATLVFAFASDRPPHAFDFGRILMNGDQVLYVELGPYASASGFGVLKGWLNSHGIK